MAPIRWIYRYSIAPWIARRTRGSRGTSLLEELTEERARRLRESLHDDEGPVWFHASSAGELEALASVVLAWAQKGHGILVTVFSRSAEPPLLKLSEQLRQTGAKLLFYGYSPAETDWRAVMGVVRPRMFLTAKYEAWPELWMALSEQGIPLVIMGARLRSSFRLIRSLLIWFGASPPPQLLLLTASEDERRELTGFFSGARVECVGEPRWDRVEARSRQGSPRAQRLLEEFRTLPRPWSVLAQAWPEDFVIWTKPVLSSIPGTVWVVPHRLDSAIVSGIERHLREAGFGVIRSSCLKVSFEAQASNTRIAVLVDELGVLVELYRSMDRAYVGGGFRKGGIHSTIEPALQAIPVAVGPEGTDQFPEITLLSDLGLLTILRGSEDVSRWLEETAQVDPGTRQRWRVAIQSQLGATQRALACIENTLF